MGGARIVEFLKILELFGGIGLITVTEKGELNYIIKAKRKHVNMGTKATLLESMTRSLNREVKKFYEKNPYWVTEEVAE